ncbi:MAG TPA: hypothetical protein DGK91_13760 [Clostridium sp.]|jgi:hypothetical protein|nr:hypothetical protein [Clostridia bacterium]HCW05481.1 hypothetical protein [Clostridium sp.]
MTNFLISAAANGVLILIFFFIFKAIISGPTRHRIYEKIMSSFAKFIIYIFIASLAITGISTYILRRTRNMAYINILAPALVSVLVGFVASTVPVKGANEEKTKS